MRIRCVLLVLCVVVLAVCGGSSNQDIDGDLAEATVKFERLLSNALQVRRSIPSTPIHIKLRGIDYNARGGDLYFENATINWISPVSVDSAVPNLGEGSVKVKSHWGVVAFSGAYGLRNSDESSQLDIFLENIEANGVAGYALKKNVAVVENMKLTFSMGNVLLKNAKTGQAFDSDDNLYMIISSYFERDLSEILKLNLKNHLNDALSEVLIEDVFDNDTTRVLKYRTAIHERSTNANSLAEELLKVVSDYIAQNGDSKIQLADMHHKFTCLGIFTCSFDGYNLHARDVSTIQRTGSFCIDGDYPNGDFTLYGSIGLRTLAVHVDAYRAKAGFISFSGHADMTVDRNSISFSVGGRLKDNVLKVTSKPLFKVASLDGIKIEVSGSIFDWFVSLLATNIFNTMKESLYPGIENGAVSVLNRVLEKLDYEIPLSR